MMQNALSNGVTRFFVPAIDSTCTQLMYELEANYPENVFLMMGLHPCYVKENYEKYIQNLLQKSLETPTFNPKLKKGGVRTHGVRRSAPSVPSKGVNGEAVPAYT
jgi:Tat protein secretion system quality control protein TatD with DNase activity